MNTEYITIESHFGVPENFIRANTRNKCSEDLVSIIGEIATILHPDEEFEIFLLPAENGCYKDTIKIVRKMPLRVAMAVAGSVTGVGMLSLAFFTYQDTHRQHLHDEKMQIIDDTSKCLALKMQIAEVSKKYDLENISNDKIEEVCGNLKLKKLKNDSYRILQSDDMIDSQETIIKKSNSEIVLKTKVERKDFEKYIEALPEEEYVKDNVTGVIELVSMVVKQKKEGRGIPWKGTYYGENIKEQGIDILLNGEDISFYMQDQDFKNKIIDHLVAFSNGDNMSAKFAIRGTLNMGSIQNKSIYVKEVQKFNAEAIEHKIKTEKTAKLVAVNNNQSTLF